MQDFDADGLPEGAVASLKPEAAAARPLEPVLAGTRAAELAELAGAQPGDITLPDASRALALPDALLTESLSPLYGRPPDAKLPGT